MVFISFFQASYLFRLQIWDKLPSLKAIIQYKGELKAKVNNVYTVSWHCTYKRHQGLNVGLRPYLNMKLSYMNVTVTCTTSF